MAHFISFSFSPLIAFVIEKLVVAHLLKNQHITTPKVSAVFEAFRRGCLSEPDKSNPPMQNYCFKILDLLKRHTPLCTLPITTLLPPFPSISEHLVPVFISIIFNPSSTSSFHPLRGLPLFFFPPIIGVAVFRLL